MKLAIIGQSAFGKAVLEALTATGDHEIVGVFAAPDGRRGREPLAETATELDLPLWQFPRMRDRECIDVFQGLNADLCVMAYVTDIVPSDIIESPTQGTIQYHPSLLPRHRGPSSINWALINGDTETGLTIFWPDEGLDTGPILMQKRVDVGANDTVGSIYFGHLFPMGVAALVDSVALVEGGEAPKIAQDESEATYEGWCGVDESRIDWDQPPTSLHNLIRGCDPQPGAWAELEGIKTSFYGSAVCDGKSTHQPGTVLGVDETGVTIAARDGAVRIKRVRIGQGDKIAAAEAGIPTGTQFS